MRVFIVQRGAWMGDIRARIIVSVHAERVNAEREAAKLNNHPENELYLDLGGAYKVIDYKVEQ